MISLVKITSIGYWLLAIPYWLLLSVSFQSFYYPFNLILWPAEVESLADGFWKLALFYPVHYCPAGNPEQFAYIR